MIPMWNSLIAISIPAVARDIQVIGLLSDQLLGCIIGLHKLNRGSFQ